MKKFVALLTVALFLTACGTKGPSEEELRQQLNAATQIGQAQAIAEIIERSLAQPCQPVNLFNNIDENNRKEVNLINITCEGLGLPDLGTAQVAEEATPETSEAPTDDQ